MMFPMVLPLPRTSASFGAGFPPCFLWQVGSASTESGLSAGGFPSKVMVPLMVDAATATPGQSNTATSPAASHNPFRVPRLFSSLVIAHLVLLVPLDAALVSLVYLAAGRLYTDPSYPGKARILPPTSGVLERERFGEPRIAQRHERLPSHQPARRRHEAPADGDERGHVQQGRTEPLGMKRRHDLPVEIQEMHGQEPRSPDGQGDRKSVV